MDGKARLAFLCPASGAACLLHGFLLAKKQILVVESASSLRQLLMQRLWECFGVR
jgi:hypothetical protein